MSTCKAFDFGLCNPRVSGRGGSGPGRPSGMPRECTWITAREEVRSEGGCTSYIQILGATAIDDLLASEQVVWTFFRRVGVSTALLGVTVESISSGEISTRHWTGEQGAASATARNRFPRVYSCKHCRLAASAKDISARAEWLRRSGRAPSELSETPWWRINPRPASIPGVALHIALRSPFHRFFLLCRSPI